MYFIGASFDKVEKKLDAVEAKKDTTLQKINASEKVFRWDMNQDAMATEKLSEGIRKFSQDLESLEKIIKAKIADFIKAGQQKSKKK